jgi:hypothetical protein
MKRTKKPKTTPKKKPLVLRRETVRTLDDDALHQTRGGGAMSGSKFAMQLRSSGL